MATDKLKLQMVVTELTKVLSWLNDVSNALKVEEMTINTLGEDVGNTDNIPLDIPPVPPAASSSSSSSRAPNEEENSNTINQQKLNLILNNKQRHRLEESDDSS